MAPLPEAIMETCEFLMQQWSATTAHVLFKLVGTPVFREDLYFQLPGMRVVIARECSGIRSTLALFLTSLIAGYLFLHSPWRRTMLAFAVIPLAVVRNAIRIAVVGELCVHISPDMIDSYIHRHGGPIFFAASLVPFAWILWLLMKRERTEGNPSSPRPS
jgi:exosortase